MGPEVIFLLNKSPKTGVQKNNLSRLSVTGPSIWLSYNHLAVERPGPELSFSQTQGQQAEKGGRDGAAPRGDGFRDLIAGSPGALSQAVPPHVHTHVHLYIHWQSGPHASQCCLPVPGHTDQEPWPEALADTAQNKTGHSELHFSVGSVQNAGLGFLAHILVLALPFLLLLGTGGQLALQLSLCGSRCAYFPGV